MKTSVLWYFVWTYIGKLKLDGTVGGAQTLWITVGPGLETWASPTVYNEVGKGTVFIDDFKWTFKIAYDVMTAINPLVRMKSHIFLLARYLLTVDSGTRLGYIPPSPHLHPHQWS